MDGKPNIPENADSENKDFCCSCGKEIPKGTVYCDECEAERKRKRHLLIPVAIIYFVIISVINTSLNNSGEYLGAIPTVLLYSPIFFMLNYIIHGKWIGKK